MWNRNTSHRTRNKRNTRGVLRARVPQAVAAVTRGGRNTLSEIVMKKFLGPEAHPNPRVSSSMKDPITKMGFLAVACF